MTKNTQNNGVSYLYKSDNEGTDFKHGGNGGGGDMETRIAKLESDVEYIKTDIRDIKSELIGQRSDFKAEMISSRNEFKAEMISSRNEFKSDMASLRNEFKTELSTTRSDFKSDIDEIKVELKVHSNDFKAIRSELSDIKVMIPQLQVKMLIWGIGIVFSAVGLGLTAARYMFTS